MEHMDFNDYRTYDALGLAELVRTGKVTPAELLEIAIARADAVDGDIHALNYRMYDIARARANSVTEGPFAGVPFLVKDLEQEYAGIPSSAGSRSLRNIPAQDNSEVVDRWLDAGLVIFGRTATSEFGTKGVTEPEGVPPTRNPWDVTRTPGGSSGGTAAAVAAGVVPVAGASDGGGSIRIPAACTGLFGLKAGRGLIPAGPGAAEGNFGSATDGVISRTVRDSAAMLDVLSAPTNPGAPFHVKRPAKSYFDLSKRDPGKLRIGFTTASPLGNEVSVEAVAAVEKTVGMLKGLGHQVEQAEPDIDGRQMSEDFLSMWCAMFATAMEDIKARYGAKDKDFELDNRLLAAAAKRMSATDFIRGQARWNDYNRALGAFHEEYDLLLTPTLAEPPVKIGALDTPMYLRILGRVGLRTGLATPLSKTRAWMDQVLANLETVPFTQLANITGRPAMSVPTYRTPKVLPLGVQFVGPLDSEPTLLQLAQQLQDETGWDKEFAPLR